MKTASKSFDAESGCTIPIGDVTVLLGANGSESGLKSSPDSTRSVVYALLSGIRTFQFHDASDTEKIKDRSYVDDEFSADQVVIVERDATCNSSVFKKLVSEDLADWLARYRLSELWEKNVLGGQP